MTVHIENVSGTGEGWSEYTLGKENDREHATLIQGNTLMGDSLIEDIEYKSGNYVRMVVSFAKEDNVSVEQGDSITKELIKNYMYGYADDEYHVDIVRHEDTDQLHYHVRFPKINLLTNTQLKVYWHKSDLGYVKATIADVAFRHNLIIGIDKKKLVKDPLEHAKRINKWRGNSKRTILDFSTNKSREVAEFHLTDYISNAVQNGLLNDLDSIKAELVAVGLEVVKEGYDIPLGFHYLTVKKDGKKIRLRGDIYDREFYKLNRETRAEKISSNTSTRRRDNSDRRDGKQIAIDLRRERNKRVKFIDRQYSSGRKRAIRKILEDSQGITLEQSQTAQTATQISSNWSIFSGDNYRYLSNPIHNKIKEQHDSIGTEISRCIRVRADKQRSRADSITRATKRIKQNNTKRIQPTKQDYRTIEQRRRGRKLIRAVSQNIGTVVRKLTVEFKRRFNNFLQELKVQTKRKKVVYENTIEEIEKEEELISPSSDMIEGYNHINSKSEEVTIKTSII